jgi:hypothetical protein
MMLPLGWSGVMENQGFMRPVGKSRIYRPVGKSDRIGCKPLQNLNPVRVTSQHIVSIG